MLLEFKYNVGWTEWFAQALAIQAQPTSLEYLTPMLDLTVTDGYFSAPQGRAHKLRRYRLAKRVVVLCLPSADGNLTDYTG